jgi:hypothetical protein
MHIGTSRSHARRSAERHGNATRARALAARPISARL